MKILIRWALLGLSGTLSGAVIGGVPFAVQAQLRSAELAAPTVDLNIRELSAPRIEAKILRVGIGGAPPFLIKNGSEFQGIVPDIWNQMALAGDFEYELVPQTQTQEALAAVARGDLDILVGPFSVTAERLTVVDFTQPFFVSGVGVLLPKEAPTLWSRVKPFFRVTALSSVGGLLLCLLLVGIAMWMAERDHNPDHFPRTVLEGVGNGMWFALVTLTTVGYGDRAPTTSLGRFIAGTWMLVSLVAVSSLIGGLASAFTLALSEIPAEGLSSAADLRGSRMAVVTGTTGEKWADEYQARLLRRSTLDEAIQLVSEGEADGAVFDQPALEYYLAQHPEANLRLASFILTQETLGFAIPHNSPLAVDLNIILLRMDEDGTLDDIVDRWLDPGRDGVSSREPE